MQCWWVSWVGNIHRISDHLYLSTTRSHRLYQLVDIGTTASHHQQIDRHLRQGHWRSFVVEMTINLLQTLEIVFHRTNICQDLLPNVNWAVVYPCSSLDNIRVMMIVWRLRGNIIRTALCWIVWHTVHSLQHTYVSSSYRSNRLGLSHWDPLAVRRGGCLELYYCNMEEWFWWDSSLISTANWFP